MLFSNTYLTYYQMILKGYKMGKNRILIFLILVLVYKATFSVNSQEISFIKKFVSPGDLIFDIGANIGLKTDVYLAIGAKVICFEPQPDCVSHLQKKYKGNEKIIIDERGIADRADILELGICSQANTISTFSKEWQTKGRFSRHGYVWDKKIMVEVVTLDQMIKKYGIPQFCKIDVENFEYEVLKGLSIPIPYLSFEFSIETFHNTKKCIKRLVELGYCYFNCTIGARNQFFFDEWLDADEIIEKIKKISPKYDDWGLIMGDIYAKYEKK